MKYAIVAILLMVAGTIGYNIGRAHVQTEQVR